MNHKNLTEKQKKVLDIILAYVKANNRPPSIREIQKLSGIHSLRGVTLQLEVLEKEGFIKRSKLARGIVINNELIESGDIEISIPLLEGNDEEKISVPLFSSSIPAGTPSIVEEHSDTNIPIALSDTKGVRNVFAVKVSGNSMIGSGIEDGDIAIITPQVIAEDGDIVAAIHDGGVTLKKYRQIEGRPVLFPTNPEYKPITENFSIQGKLVNIIKSNQA
jgi:repressor LexA